MPIDIASLKINKDIPRICRLAKEGSWIVVGQIASALGALILVRVLTGRLDPVQYGQLALGLTVAGLVNQVVTGGIAAGIGRFYSIAAEKKDLPGYLRASRWLMTYSTLTVVAIGLVLMVGLFFLGYSQWMGLAAAALVFSVISGFNDALNGIQNAARQRAIVAFHGGLNVWLNILLAVGIMLWLGASSTTVVIGYICSSLLVTVSQLFFLRRTSHLQHAQSANYQPWIRQMWAYSWPMVAGGLFNWGYFASQRWALEIFSSTEDVGCFYALTQVAYTPVSMAGAMFLSFLTPILFARSGDAQDRDRLENVHRIVLRVVATGLCLTVSLVIASYFTHDFIFRLIVAPEYRTISKFMPYVVLAAGILQVSMTMASTVLIRKRTADILPLAIWGQLYISAQNFLLVYFLGIRGLIISMNIGAVLHLAWMSVIVSRQKAVR